jgi:hypothetical protein
MLVFTAALMILLMSPIPGLARDNGSASADGLSARDQARWMDAQFNLAQALQRYGAGSPEAAGAEDSMITMARQLGIAPPDDLPETTSALLDSAADGGDGKTADSAVTVVSKQTSFVPVEKTAIVEPASPNFFIDQAEAPQP